MYIQKTIAVTYRQIDGDIGFVAVQTPSVNVPSTKGRLCARKRTKHSAVLVFTELLLLENQHLDLLGNNIIYKLN